MKNAPLLARFSHATAGFAAALGSERNFRIQLALGCVAMAVTIALNPPLVWTALVVVMTGAVLAAELINTALEHALDAAHPQPSPLVKIAKDCSAAAVLVLCVSAIVVFVLMLLAVVRVN
jgi:diacylglycerol kinase (ATP)